MLKFPCLVLDHDDTVVRSTPTIHYPAFVEALKKLRPDIHWTLEQFIAYNFDPGFEALCRDILHFTPEEMAIQEAGWIAWSNANIAPAFEGMDRLLRRFKEQGGLVCVVSHSNSVTIRRDYKHHFGFEPDLIFGWELGTDKRKPAPWPLCWRPWGQRNRYPWRRIPPFGSGGLRTCCLPQKAGRNCALPWSKPKPLTSP